MPCQWRRFRSRIYQLAYSKLRIVPGCGDFGPHGLAGFSCQAACTNATGSTGPTLGASRACPRQAQDSNNKDSACFAREVSPRFFAFPASSNVRATLPHAGKHVRE